MWHYTTIKKYEFELHNKVSLDWLLALGPSLGVARVPGIGLVYTDLISGIPANFSRFVTNLPAYHQVLVFVCVKAVPVPFVPPEERFLVGRVGPASHRSYRCIVRYGYRDVHQDVDSFESQLVASLAEFVRHAPSKDVRGEETLAVVAPPPMDESLHAESVSLDRGMRKRVRFVLEEDDDEEDGPAVKEELEELKAAEEAGTAFILGHSHVKAKSGSSLVRRLAIDAGYNFLRRNCRGPDVALRVPPASLLEVGMVYII